MKIVIIFFMFIYNCNCSIKIANNLSTIANYVQYIIDKQIHNSQGYIGIITNNDVNHKVLKSIHFNCTNTFVVFNFKQNNHQNNNNNSKVYFGDLKLLIIFIKTKNETYSIFNRVKTLSIFRPRSRVLLIYDEPLEAIDLKSIFKYFWTHKFLQVLIIYETQNIEIFRYNPFFDKLENITKNQFKETLFPDKLTNINGQNITTLIIIDDDYTKIKILRQNGSVKYGGYDVEIIWNLIRAMNGTAIFKNIQEILGAGEKNPWRYSNCIKVNVSQKKQQLISRNGAEMLNSDELMLNDDLYGVTESLYPHDKDDLVFVLKRGQKIPYYLYLFMIFDRRLWMFLVLMFVFVVSIWVFIRKMDSKWVIGCASIYATMFCNSTGQLPRRSSERLLYIFWILYCLIIATGFQSKLTDILMEAKYYPDITTLEGLQKSGLKIQVFRSIQMLLNQSLTGTSHYGLMKQMINVDSIYDKPRTNLTFIKYTMHVFKDPGIISHNRGVYATRSLIFCSNTRKLVKVIPESPMPRYMAFQVAFGTPFLNKLDKTLARFNEFGFLKYWYSKWDYYGVLKKFTLPLNYKFTSENSEFEAMTLQHFTGAFLLLFVGLMLSFFVFFIEIVKIV